MTRATTERCQRLSVHSPNRSLVACANRHQRWRKISSFQGPRRKKLEHFIAQYATAVSPQMIAVQQIHNVI